jgi:hypothetical protein
VAADEAAADERAAAADDERDDEREDCGPELALQVHEMCEF